MAVIYETGRCCCCVSLRAGIQFFIVFYIIVTTLNLHSSFSQVWSSFTPNQIEWHTFKRYGVSCGDLPSFKIKLTFTGVGQVQALEVPFMSKDLQEDLGEYDYTTWKLEEVTEAGDSGFASDKVVFPPESKQKTDDEVQKIIKHAATVCEGGNLSPDGQAISKSMSAEQRVLWFKFNWAADPVNADYVAKDLADRASGVLRHQVRSCWYALSTCVWLAGLVYLVSVVFGSFDAIVEKKTSVGKARNLLLGWFAIDSLVAMLWLVLLNIRGDGWFMHVYDVMFMCDKLTTLVFVVHFDNLNDVIQAGGDGSEKLSAGQLQDKLANEETPLLGTNAVVGEVVKVDETAMPPV